MMHTEIERKWELAAFPDLPVESEAEQEQGYLCFAPNTVRIRKTVCDGQTGYVLTIKSDGGLTRTEVELDLDAGRYEALRGLLLAPPARKKYKTYRLPGGEKLECSLVDEGEATSFLYAEVEFDSEEQAAAFTPPPFLGRELTGQPGCSMAAYCRRKAGLQE